MSGRIVVVTGASRGIGSAIATAFGAAGDRVVINHPGEPEAASTTARLVEDAGGTATIIEADVGDPVAVARMDRRIADDLGIVDVLVNNAGICPFADFFDIDIDLWQRVHDVNLRGVFLVTQAVTRRMVAAGRGGRVISISSISAVTGGAQQVHYCATKAGVSSLMKSLAVVLGPKGISCTAVLPGVIETDINADDIAQPGRRQFFDRRIPLGLGRPADVAGVVRLLAEPGAAYLNGAEILCDGGMLVNVGT